MIPTLKAAKRVIMVVVGFTVLLVGLFLLVTPLTPGGVPVTVAGLALLAVEFVWARKLLKRFQAEGERLRDLFFRRDKNLRPPAPKKSKENQKNP